MAAVIVASKEANPAVHAVQNYWTLIWLANVHLWLSSPGMFRAVLLSCGFLEVHGVIVYTLRVLRFLTGW